MKKAISVLFAVIILSAFLTACSINLNINMSTEEPAQPATSAAETALSPTENPTQPPAKPVIGKLSDYVKTAKENTVSFGDGNTVTLRLPEILIESADADAANLKIMNAYGKAVNGGANYTGVYNLDYEAYLNESVLSVIITAKYNGGNSYGMALNFDVLTGSGLDNSALCTAANRDLAEVETKLEAELIKSYDDKWSTLPGNDSMRAKTLTKDNIKSSELYLDEKGGMSALVKTYAAVGGGEFLMQINID